jgi:large subunit ribosomal protein L9
MMSMKVVLMQDVPNLGRNGEIKEVSGGYGRNYLIPKGFAVLATPGLIRQADQRAAAQQRRDQKARSEFEQIAQRINGQTLRFQVRVGELDRLYGAITNADIAAKLQQQFGLEVDRRRIDLGDPIKRAGVYSVPVRLSADLEPRLNVVVEGAQVAPPEGGNVASVEAVDETQQAGETA